MESPGLYRPSLHRFSIVLAIATLFLVVAGASVTSKEAGLSVPDWPLSYGQVMPEMTGGVFYEHGHRMIATTVGMLTVILAIWLWRAEKRPWMRKLGVAALAAVIVQGLLGGLTVLLLLPPAVSISHACLAQLFFSTTVAIAIFTSRPWLDGAVAVHDHGWPSLRSLSILVPLMVLAQVALGAGFRHRAFGLLPHIIGALVVASAITLIAAFVLHQFPEHPALRKSAKVLLTVTAIQVFLGIFAYLVRARAATDPLPMVIVTVAHVAMGALTLASSIALSIQIRRNVSAHVAHTRTAAVAS
jgi:cytochrome c oxidase assembly protein subunit 15